MITVHHLNNSRSQRILWLLEELGLEYEIKLYQRDPQTDLAPESLKKVHPLGKSPVISDGELTIAESGTIVEYLAETYGKQLIPPADSPVYWQYKYWLHYAEGSLMPPLVMKLVFDKVKEAPLPFFIKPVTHMIAYKVNQTFLGPTISTNLRFIENHLASHAYFAGDTLTGADFKMTFALEAAGSRGVLDGNFPRIKAYLEKVHAREAYQRALKAGGPYAYA